MRLPWECRDKLQESNWRHCVTEPELTFFRKRKGILKIDQSEKNAVGVACSYSSALSGLARLRLAMSWHIVVDMSIDNAKPHLIGHFRVRLSLHFKARLSAKSLLWKSVFIHIEIGTNYHNKRYALRLALKERLRGTRNGLFVKHNGFIDEFDETAYWGCGWGRFELLTPHYGQLKAFLSRPEDRIRR